MSTSSSPPAPSPSTPPSSNSTAPPPSPPSAPSPSNSTSPPPSTPLAPPPSTPSAPPPSTPSAPPPSTPSTPSAPPPSTPSAPPPSTPSAPSPPAPLTPSASSPPPPSGRSPPVTHSPPSTKPPPSARSPPSHSSSSSSSSSISTPAVVGIAVGAVVILAVLSLICICCRKKRRRVDPPFAYYSGAPPPLPPQKDDIYGGQPPSWQHSASPPPDHVVRIPPQPLAPPPHASRPPHQLPHYPTPAPPPPPPISGSSAGSGSLYSEPLPPPSPSFALGFSKSTFTFEELAVATNGFSDANLLGQGGFGYVHKGVLPNGQEVAIKQLKSGSGQGEREFQAEVEIISRVHHRHLVSLVGYCMAEEQRLLVYEYVPNKTLDFHLHGKDVPTMDWPTRLKIALGSAKGLAYLHEDCHPKIIHRDIKASNILLDFKFEAKVADFGLAKFASDNNTHISTRVMGTFGYLAPEYASSGKLTEKSDVFSFGVMLLELITGRKPVDSTETYIDDSLVDWARPLMARAMEDGIYDTLTDPQLGRNYNHNEMARLVACAASCVRHSARRRPRMSQIVRALEGNVSLEDLNEGIRPGHSTPYGNSHGSSDYDSSQYNEDMKKFRKMALATRDYASSEYSAPTSEYGQIPSAPSSSEGQGQDTREMEMAKIKKDKTSQGFSSGSQL